MFENGGDDGEGRETYKQLYELRNAEFQNMVQERDRFADKDATNVGNTDRDFENRRGQSLRGGACGGP